MGKNSETRKNLSSARNRYYDDMKWLRRKFGIIPEIESRAVKETLLVFLDAAEHNDASRLKTAVSGFEKLHKSVMIHVAWNMLEQTKLLLKQLKKENIALFEEKRKVWSKASWSYTQAIFLRKNEKFREAIQLVSKI